MTSKAFIFVSYAFVCVFVILGLSVLSVSGLINDPVVFSTFIGCYGFFSITATFFVLAKFKATNDELEDMINKSFEEIENLRDALATSLCDRDREINHKIDECVSTLSREIDALSDSLDDLIANRETESSKI